MIAQSYKNNELQIEITSYIDKQQNIWFKGKDVAEILGYSKIRDALSKHVDNEDKKQLFTYHDVSVHKMGPLTQKSKNAMAPGSMCTYINESGFYSLVLSSKLETAKKFKR